MNGKTDHIKISKGNTKIKQELLQSEEWYAIWHKTKHQQKSWLYESVFVFSDKSKNGELLRFSNVNPATSSSMFCKTLRVEGE